MIDTLCNCLSHVRVSVLEQLSPSTIDIMLSSSYLSCTRESGQLLLSTQAYLLRHGIRTGVPTLRPGWLHKHCVSKPTVGSGPGYAGERLLLVVDLLASSDLDVTHRSVLNSSR